MIGSLGDGITSGEIPRHYRGTTRPEAVGSEIASHHRVQEAALKIQNYPPASHSAVTICSALSELHLFANAASSSGRGADHPALGPLPRRRFTSPHSHFGRP
jgi:hypothetical protein